MSPQARGRSGESRRARKQKNKGLGALGFDEGLGK
jgi:hypothetical protein